jgi:hypothetical protein
VVVLAGLSEIQRRQLVSARIALIAGWDAELRVELQDLKALGTDLSI